MILFRYDEGKVVLTEVKDIFEVIVKNLPNGAAKASQEVFHCNLSLLFYTAELQIKYNPEDNSHNIDIIFDYIYNHLIQWLSKNFSDVFGRPNHSNTKFFLVKDEIKVCKFYNNICIFY